MIRLNRLSAGCANALGVSVVLANFLKWLCDGKQVVPEGPQMRARSGVIGEHTGWGCRVSGRNAVQIVSFS